MLVDEDDDPDIAAVAPIVIPDEASDASLDDGEVGSWAAPDAPDGAAQVGR